MRRKERFAAGLAFTLTAGLSLGLCASAADVFSIDMTDYDNTPWTTIAMANDDTVKTGVSIRAAESTDSQVVGYLYRGGAVNVLRKGTEWSEVESGGLTGYIRSEYLTFGTEAKGLAEYYGYYGVEANWDDVRVFAADSADAKIIGTANDGDTYPILNNNGHWLEVSTGEGSAYVSSEDVTMVMVVDTAVALDAGQAPGTSSARAAYAPESEAPSYDAASSAGSYEEPAYEQPADQGSYDETYTDGTDTDASYSDVTYDEGTYDTGSDDEGTYDEEGSYDEESYEEVDEGTYEDESYVDETWEDTYVEDAQVEEDYAEGTYEESYSEETYEESYEESYSEETYEESQDTSYASSDADLLAAIIWCEAGNQPYEGMVAVGAVVMNRVASGSFPNTISEVIYQSGQFTPAYSGTLSSALASGVPDSCYSAAYDALAGSDPTGGALYFNTSHGSGVQIGAHWFY